MTTLTYLGLEAKDWAIIFATVCGPVLAVQAQKAIELIRERRHRKASLFANLMATRAARVSSEHVRGLNMIDIIFYGERSFGFLHRSKREQVVLDCWKEYLDHLNNKYSDETFQLWVAKGDELFTNLLYAISQDVGYTFDRVQLRSGAYSPIAHGELERDQAAVRQGVISLLAGETHLNMNIVGTPATQTNSTES